MAAIKHGTWQGYKQEIYIRDGTCGACREAWRTYCYGRADARSLSGNTIQVPRTNNGETE